MNIANVFTASRVVLAPFAYFAGFTGRKELFLTLFILGALTDGLDGLFARKFKQQSKFGDLLDTAADTVFYPSAISIYLLVPEMKGLGELFAVSVIALAASLLYCHVQGKLAAPHPVASKAAACMVLLLVIVTLTVKFYPWLLYLTTAACLLSAFARGQ